MKKKIFFLVCFVIIEFSVTSCDMLSKDCKTCRKVYYSGTIRDHEDEPTQYCGADLVTVETTLPATYGSLTVKYECN